jgi:putative transposase
VVDNYAPHKHPKVKAWLAKHPRYHMHFTPTYSSWLNQVERWFGLVTQQAIRRGSFRNVRQLITSIERYVQQYNQHKRAFVWTATADSILKKVAKLCKVISGTEH